MIPVEMFLNGPRAILTPLAAQTFPDDTPTRILRKARLNCSVYAKDCQLFFTTVEEASSLPPIPVPLKKS
ncbi:MAG TPA: hypothetical protein VGR55_17405 [Candidatus Acidoferrum sp.]|nr:hypothetical protein [Candidatus Acidoferrum sp.]